MMRLSSQAVGTVAHGSAGPAATKFGMGVLQMIGCPLH